MLETFIYPRSRHSSNLHWLGVLSKPKKLWG